MSPYSAYSGSALARSGEKCRLGLASAGFLRLSADPLTGGPCVLVGDISAGGGTSSGGSLAISGWVASAGAGTSTGADYELTCGLLGIHVVPPDAVSLRVGLTVGGDVRLWWPVEVTGYQLESTAALESSADWQPVEPQPSRNDYIADPFQPVRFFRLRQL